MKINKLFTGFIAMASLLLAACSSDDDYSWEKVSGAQVYFSNELPDKVDLNKEEHSFSFPLNRLNTEEELTVKLTLTDESGMFSIPTEVKFIDGQAKANITVSYDPSKFEYDDYKDVKISIAGNEYTTPYGMSSYTFSAGLPAPFRSLGIALLDDNFIGVTGAEVEVLQSLENPNLYRLMHPYDEIAELLGENGYNTMGKPAEYVDITVLQPGNTINGVTVTQTDLIYYNPFSCGVDLFDLGMVTGIYHPSALGRNESGWTYNRVTGWQENGLPGQIQLAPIYMTEEGRGSDQSKADGIITITLPGYNPKDYTVSVSYLGAFVDKNEKSFATANIKLGADVNEAKVAVVEGNNADEALNAILSETVETITVTENGEVKIPCEYSGECTVIAVSYAGGEAMDYDYDTFTFSLKPSSWKSIGKGLYTDHLFHRYLQDQDGNPVPAPTYAVDIEESTENPGVYRLMRPYHPDVYYYRGDFGYDTSKDYNIVINAGDPDAVYIDQQPLGFPEDGDDILFFTKGWLYLYNGNSFDVIKKNGLFKGTVKNGVISFEKEELCYSMNSVWAQGRYGILNGTEAAQVLVLPQAVSAKELAMAKNNSRKAMRKTGSKSMSKTMSFSKKSFRYQLPNKFNVVKTSLNIK